MLRIAVLGCGRIGRMHAANVAAHPRAKLASVYDTHRPFAEEVAARSGITAADSADAIFASGDIDAVLVATATDTHADYIERAVAAGKPVLCEKPIDLSLARVNACAEKIKGANVVVQLARIIHRGSRRGWRGVSLGVAGRGVRDARNGAGGCGGRARSGHAAPGLRAASRRGRRAGRGCRARGSPRAARP